MCTKGLHSFQSFGHCWAASTVIPLLPKATNSHHPSSLTSVSLLPAFHLLPPSTPFWPYGTHPFFSHAQTFSILSDLIYLLTPFNLIPGLLRTFSFLTPSNRDTPTKLLKHFISRTFAFLLLALLIYTPMPLLCTTPLVQLLLHTCRYFLIGLYLKSSIAQHTFQRSPLSTPIIQSVSATTSAHVISHPDTRPTIYIKTLHWFQQYCFNSINLSICHIRADRSYHMPFPNP